MKLEKPTLHTPWSRSCLFWTAIFWMLNTIDATLTAAVLQAGGTELNPGASLLMRWFSMSGWVLLKSTTPILTGMLVWMVFPKAMRLMTVIMALVVLWNLGMICVSF